MTDYAIRVDDLSKTFGSKVVLDQVSLDIEAGSVYGLLGPNGAGKTTLIRILATLLSPSMGRVTVAGADVSSDPRTVREHIGLAGQFAAVDAHLSGRENLVMVGRLYNIGRAEARRRAGDVLHRIHLDDEADNLVRTYSGGTRRRLDLAASMVGRPPVLFLDEPTSGVDPRNRLDIWEFIEEMVDDGTTLLLTTQYLEEAERLADRIGVISHGRMVAEGTAGELKDRLGGHRVELTVAAADLPGLHLALGAYNDSAVFDKRRGTARIAAPRGTADLETIMGLLDASAIIPTEIGLRRPSLDDVFMALTTEPQHESDGMPT